MLVMAEAAALKPADGVAAAAHAAGLLASDEANITLKVEVKAEPRECVCALCAGRCTDAHDLFATTTSCGTVLARFLSKYTQNDLSSSSRYLCKNCLGLVDVLEQAELEYLKLKEAFEAIISKNPLFSGEHRAGIERAVKCEAGEGEELQRGDSDDEPLAVAKSKRRRKVVARRKKVPSTAKRKPPVRNKRNDSWDESESVEQILPDLKTEDSQDGSDNSQLNNGLENMCKMEFEVDDDESSTFCPDELSDRDGIGAGGRRRGRRPAGAAGAGEKAKKKQSKVVHQCDQCDAKYTSLRRFEAHMEKHSDGKPPFICEVCGAHYKHKRACDIHVGMHKGISDWKCEECNKLFPSKGALQRHNNIHTGKLNYQCDLCGKSFIHTSSFKMHKLSHTGVKPHACDVCGLALMTRSHLKRHKRVHSGEKRHECRTCGKRFSERYNLLAHSKMHESAGEAPGVVGASTTEQPPRRRLFRCGFCPERFERRYMLERHSATEHGRALERVPATPRNTMSKLLKAQAQQRANNGNVASANNGNVALATGPPTPANSDAGDVIAIAKAERSPDARASLLKLQLTAASSWSSAYAAEFGIRHDFPH